MLSKACEHSLRAIMFLSSQSDEIRFIDKTTIAEAIQAPAPFVSKLLQQLSKAGIIHSSRGKYGGFRIGRKSLKTYSLFEIVKCIDGQEALQTCIMGLEACSSSKPCPLHHAYKPIRKSMHRMLSEKSLNDYLDDMSLGKTQLKTVQQKKTSSKHGK